MIRHILAGFAARALRGALIRHILAGVALAARGPVHSEAPAAENFPEGHDVHAYEPAPIFPSQPRPLSKTNGFVNLLPLEMACTVRGTGRTGAKFASDARRWVLQARQPRRHAIASSPVTNGVPVAVVATRITSPKAVDAQIRRRRACTGLGNVVACRVLAFRVRRAGVGPGPGPPDPIRTP